MGVALTLCRRRCCYDVQGLYAKVTQVEVRLAHLRERELRLFGAEALAPGGEMHETRTTFMV